ncbi:MAG: sulfur oxidation c-type cytochrome SoxA [Rhodobacteraceae bacterium]|nr:sulfur oxidation c-type cytochrome SoxA [Paracoccaceae bacterium]
MIGSNLLRVASIASIATFAFGTTAANAQSLVINDEETMIIQAPAAAHLENMDEVFSGWNFRTVETQALQMDDFDNPGMIFVDQAIDQWDTVDGAAGESCGSCHEGGTAEFAGLRTVLPRWDEDAGGIQSMADYINECRTERMQAEAWTWSSSKMTAMTALIGLESRGMPVDVVIDGPAADAWELGKEIYYTRVGQLDMSCANCHEDNYDTMIRADHLSQGQINGFPSYRLKNAKLNSTHARFKGCMKNIRAKPFGEGSDEFRALELYVASRGNGLSVEGTSVRN